MWWRLFGGVVATLLLAAAASTESSDTPPRVTLDCETALNAGAVECVVTESFIAAQRFPDMQRFAWPPEGYLLRDRALLVEPSDGSFCVVPIRALQRERDALYSEDVDRLPALHEGFPMCTPTDVLRPDEADYHTIVRLLRQILPAPNVTVRPSGNTILGIPTIIDWVQRPQPFTVTRPVALADGITVVTISGDVTSYLSWTFASDTTGPHNTEIDAVHPTYVYREPGDEQIHVIDVWTVRVTAQGVRPFHDVVYVVHAPVNVRVNELVIRAQRTLS